MIYVLTGTNSFLLRAAYTKLIGDFVHEHGELALEKLDGEVIDVEQFVGALQSLPFLASKKMVVVQGLSKNKSLVEQSGDLLSGIPDSTDLVIVEGKLDKRSVYYKTLKKLPGFTEYEELDEAALAQWAVNTASDVGAELTRSDAGYLVHRVGPNQQLLASELTKLALYSPQITKDAITDMIDMHPRSTVFELLDAAFHGDTSRTIELYDEQRALKVEPQAILALIAWQIHILALIKVAGASRSPADIACEGHVSPYVVNKSMTIAKRLTTLQIRSLVHDVLTVDARIKSEPIDPDAALIDLLVRIASGTLTSSSVSS